MRLGQTSVSSLFSCTLLLTALPACSQPRPAHERPPPPTTNATGMNDDHHAKWEKVISAYEAMDRAHPPRKGGVLFIGSSTIGRWKTLDEDFPNHRVINRGFGGSHIADATHFAERVIFPHEPRMIFLRAGGNDVNAGKSPERVLADYKAFVAKVHARLPKTRIVYISVSPSPANWRKRHVFQSLNSLIENYTREHPYLAYLETFDMVLGPDGEPREELYVADRLHLNAEGYRLLADRVRPLLP